jgi:DMSO/TMAO reductase YedYZ molybdopterin-dependent catalytic subunit
VNRTARGARVVGPATDPGYRLRVEGAVRAPLALSLDDLRRMPTSEATLPIACVDGWSANERWRGVPLRQLLELAGAAPGAEVLVESLQPTGLYRTSIVNAAQAADHATLLALEVNGEPLHIDHGFPVRLIGPNRPGVMQTKWVGRLLVR